MSKVKPLKTAIIGCGMICDSYFEPIIKNFSVLDIVGCADMIDSKAAEKAEKYNIKKMTVDEILADSEIELVLNLTYALSHFEISKAVLNAKKHLYCEKMMAINMQQADELMALAKENNVRFAVAPDTFLGASMQTARFVIDSGLIGEPIFADIKLARGYHMVKNNDEDARRLFSVMRPGGGIPYDMGGYYLHTLFNLFGSVNRASGFCFTKDQNRPYLNPRHSKFGENFFVDTPNTLVAALEFDCGFHATMAMSSECFGDNNSFEIVGTDGILDVGDPNHFGKPLFIKRKGGERTLFPFTHPYSEQSRGIGAAELGWSIRKGRTQRLIPEMGYHALEIIEALRECTKDNTVKTFNTKFKRPAALSSHWYENPETQELILAE